MAVFPSSTGKSGRARNVVAHQGGESRLIEALPGTNKAAAIRRALQTARLSDYSRTRIFRSRQVRQQRELRCKGDQSCRPCSEDDWARRSGHLPAQLDLLGRYRLPVYGGLCRWSQVLSWSFHLRKDPRHIRNMALARIGA